MGLVCYEFLGHNLIIMGGCLGSYVIGAWASYQLFKSRNNELIKENEILYKDLSEVRTAYNRLKGV